MISAKVLMPDVGKAGTWSPCPLVENSLIGLPSVSGMRYSLLKQNPFMAWSQH